MRGKSDLTNEIFERLLVISFSHKNHRGELYWLCKCNCGNTIVTQSGNLRQGRTKSCGCIHKESVSKHNMTKTRTFKSWESMKQRCTNKKAPDYDRYGGRGIKICDKWIHSFENFLMDMGERPENTSLDRIDVNGDYEKENCRWATYSYQMRNKRNTKKFLYEDKMMCLAELGEISGLKPSIISNRLKAGWDINSAMTKPSRKSLIN